VDNDEIATVWFVIFDGAGQDLAKTALLAEERSPGSYYGFWTYDPVFVDRIIDHLNATLDRITHH
jgi:DICT domain-containing protein